jgi:hypothetical protein
MAEELGLSDAMISFLREADTLPGSDEGLILKESELKRLKQFNIYFNQTMDNVKRQSRQFGVAVAPIADYMLFAFQKVTGSILFLSEKLKYLNDVSGGKFFSALTIGALGLAAALFPTVFAVTSFLLVFQDLIGFFKGENSVIGFWLSQFQSWKDILESIPALIATIVDTLTLGLFTDKITKGLQFVTGSLKTIAGEEGVAASAEFASNMKAQKSTTVAGALMGDYSTLAEAGLDTPVGRNTNVINNVTITVDGAKDPKLTGFAIQDIINKQNNFSLRQMPIGEAP